MVSLNSSRTQESYDLCKFIKGDQTDINETI